MPFPKWNIEPVCLGRGTTPPWSNNSNSNSNNHHHPNIANKSHVETPTPGVAPSTQSSSDSSSSYATNVAISLSPYSVILEPLPEVFSTSSASDSQDEQLEEDEEGGNSDDGVIHDDSSVLANIQIRVLVGGIRQLGALAIVAEQMFGELTDECRRLCERTVSMRTRIDRLSSNVDRANLTMKRTPPQVGNLIAEYAKLATCERWQSMPWVQYNLFTPSTRPWSIQDVYARAHAPGDVRLSRGSGTSARSSGQEAITLGYPSPFVTIMRNSRRGRGATTTGTMTRGKLETTCTRASSHPPDCRCSCHSASSDSPPKSTTPLLNQAGHYNQYNSHNRKRNSSSPPSSVVTWSSLASSSVFGPSDTHLYGGGNSHRQSNLPHPPPMSNGQRQFPLSMARKSQTIDDFFRDHNVHQHLLHQQHGPNGGTESERTESRLENGDCDQCDCHPDQDIRSLASRTAMLSRQDSVNSSSHHSASLQDPTGHWAWMLSDDEHRRWSSALTSPLKPANLDELSVWLRENIETRKPENVVLKSVSDLGDVELERKLRPMHSMTLRQPRTIESENDILESENEESRPSKLKRRWSMLIPRLRRRSTPAPPASRCESQSPVRNTSEPFFSRLTRNRQSLPVGSRISTQSTSQQVLANSDSGDYSGAQQQQQQQHEEQRSPCEVYLVTPNERAALLAKLYAKPQVVDINITGRNFDRLSSTRRSLIHSDFHVPRHRISGYSRSRSPTKSRRSLRQSTAGGLNSPKTPVAERGCQTDDTSGDNFPNRTEVAVEVHQNPHHQDVHRLAHHHQQQPQSQQNQHHHHHILQNNAHLSSSSSTLDRAHSLPRSAITRSAIIAAAQNKQKNSALNKQKKSNNYRSSSGNWSAATSDFLGSSTSSSPLHVPRTRVKKQNSNDGERTSGQHGTEEVESVYSCDNDGYYTSMHTDSLMFGGYSGPSSMPQSRTSSSHRSHGLAQQFRRAFEEIKEESSNAGSKSNLLSSNKDLYGSNESINSILSQSTDHAVIQDDGIRNGNGINEFDCSVSHCSHHEFNDAAALHGLYSKSKIETVEEEESDATLRSDSYSIKRPVVKKSASLRHQQSSLNAKKRHQQQQHAQQLTRSATCVDPKNKPSINQSSLMNVSSSSRTLLGRHSSLTESSSASSLCRRMPPPPPPPRVSSMLSTLKQFQDRSNANDGSGERGSPTDDDLDTASMSLVSESRHGENRCDSVASSLVESASHYSYSNAPMNGAHHSGQRLLQQQPSVAESETNSEYLRNANERRQRLFMNVDSARSYPPLSYIPCFDHAEPDPETATTLSVSSSVCFEDDDTLSRPQSFIGGSSTVSSSHTITPDTREQDEEINGIVTTTTTTATAAMGADNGGGLQDDAASVATLERRHLSSPTPAPQLDSVVVEMRSKDGDCSKTPPTPAPRNSLYVSTEDEDGVPLGSFSTTTSPNVMASPLGGVQKHSISADNSPALTKRRQFTAQDLYTIVHNQKRKHNLKTVPTIYATTTAVRSKTDDDAKLSSTSSIPLHGSLPRPQGPKRHSLAEPPQSPRKDCSIAQRFGPLRPTTLHDFKKLLSQVRPPTGSGAVSNSNSQKESPTSTYSSLQQVLKSVAGGLENNEPVTPNGGEMLASIASTCSTESGLSSMLSPSSDSSLASPRMSPKHRSNIVSSPVRKRAFAAGLASNKSTENQIANANSMNDFIRKFAKQKLTSVNGGVDSIGAGLSATARLSESNPIKNHCPPIPEDDHEPATLDEEHDPSSTWV